MKKTYLFAATSIFVWSTIATISKILLGSLNSFQVLNISAIFGALFLLIVNIVTGNIKNLKAFKLKDYIITALIGLTGTCFYNIFYYGGTSRMLASQAFIVNYLWPIMSVVFACIILKEKMTLRKIIAIAMSFLGVVIVTGGDILKLDQNTIIGAGSCILGAMSYGLFTALNQKYNYDKCLAMMIAYVATFLFTTVINVARGDMIVPDLGQTLGLMWNGAFVMAVGSTCWAIALESGKTAKISNLAYITPFLSLLWTFFVLGEPIKLTSIAGLVVIILGIFIQLKDRKQTD